MVYQWYNSTVLPNIVKKCMQTVHALSDAYELVQPEHGKFDRGNIHVRSESDVLRCHLLANDKTGVWVDTDTECIKPFIPPNDGLAYWSQGRPGWANGDVIFCNGQTKLFKALIKHYNKLDIADQRPGWLQRLINTEYRDQIGLIPAGYYVHLSLCHTSHLTEGQVMSNGQCILKMINGELVRIG